MAHLRVWGKALALVASLALATFVVIFVYSCIFPYATFVYRYSGSSVGYPYSFAGWCRNGTSWRTGPDSNYTYDNISMENWGETYDECFPKEFTKFFHWLDLNPNLYDGNIGLWRNSNPRRCLSLNSTWAEFWNLTSNNTCPCGLKFHPDPYIINSTFNGSDFQIYDKFWMMYTNATKCLIPYNYTFEYWLHYDLIENVTFAQHFHLTLADWSHQLNGYQLYFDVAKIFESLTNDISTCYRNRIQNLKNSFARVKTAIFLAKFDLKLFKEKTPWWMVVLFMVTKAVRAFCSIFELSSLPVSYAPIISTGILVANIMWQVFSVSFAIEITYFNLLAFFTVMIVSLVTFVWWAMSIESSEEFNEKILRHKRDLIKHKYYMTLFIGIFKILIFMINAVAVAWCYALIEDLVEFFDTFEIHQELTPAFILITFFTCLLSVFLPGFFSYVLRKSYSSPTVKNVLNVLCILTFILVIALYIYFFLLWRFALDTTYFLVSLFCYMFVMKSLRAFFLSYTDMHSGRFLHNAGDHETMRFNSLLRWMSSCAIVEIFSDFARLLALIVIIPSFTMICLHLKWMAVMVFLIFMSMITLLWQVARNFEALWTTVSKHFKVKGYNNYEVRYCAEGFSPKVKLEFVKQFFDRSFKLYVKEIENRQRSEELAKDRELKLALEQAKLTIEAALKNNQLNLEVRKINHESEGKIQLEMLKTMSQLFVKAADEALHSEAQVEDEWPANYTPDYRKAVDNMFRYTVMLALGQIRDDGMFISVDGIREISNELSASLPLNWKKNFDIMSRLFAPSWPQHRERLIAEHGLSDLDVQAYELLRQSVEDKVNDQNLVHDRPGRADMQLRERLDDLRNNVWIRFIENIERQVKTTQLEFNSNVNVNLQEYNAHVPNARIDYKFGEEILANPQTVYYVTDLWASTETEACKEAEKFFLNQGLDIQFQGLYSEFAGDIAAGEWQAKMTDKYDVHVSTKAFNFFENIVFFVMSKICDLIGMFFGQWYSFYAFFTGSIQADIVKEFIEYLQTTNYFPNSGDQTFDEILMNQNDVEVNNYVKKLSAEQSRSFQLFKDLITVNPANFHRYRVRYETPSPKEILNAYNKILKQRNITMESSVDYTALSLDLVYSRIIRPYMCLPTKLPKQLKLYSNRQNLVFIPSAQCVNSDKYMELEPYNSSKRMCIVLSSLGNNYISGHETKTCHYLHNNQNCPATYRCQTNSGWQSRDITGKIKYLFSNLSIEDIVLVQENLSRTFGVQNSKMEARIPINDMYYMTNPMGTGKYGILTSANVEGNALLFTAAHVVSFRGDGKYSMGPGTWGEYQIGELDKMVPVKAKAMSVTGECEMIENGKVGIFYAPKWFRLRNLLNQDFLGCVVSLDREGACVKLYDLNKNEVKLTPNLNLTNKDLHTQEKQSFVIRIDRESDQVTVPVIQPLMNLDSENIHDFCYKSAPGDSGSPIVVGDALKAIHLGGYSDGTGGAYVGVTCDTNGPHFTTVKKLNNVMNDDAIYNKFSNQLEEWEKHKKEEPFYDDRDDTYYVEKTSRGYVGKQKGIDGDWRVQKFATLDELKDLVNTGKLRGATVVWLDNGRQQGDVDFKKEEMSWTEFIQRFEGKVDSFSDDIRGHTEYLKNQVEVSMKAYNEASQLLPEDEVVNLLKMDLCDLVDFKGKLTQELSDLKSQLIKLKVLRDLLEKDPAYKKKKKEYELALLQFAQDKREYEKLMIEYKALKDQRKKTIQQKVDEVQSKIKELSQKKMTLIQESQAYFTEVKAKQKILVNDLTNAEKQLSEMKKLKEVDPQKVENLQAELNDLKKKLDEYKECYRKKRNELHKAELGTTSQASEELLNRVTMLKAELNKLNLQKKTKASETTHLITDTNLQLSALKKNVNAVKELPKPAGPVSPVKPKFDEGIELTSIKDHLARVSKLNKAGEKIKKVIDLILKEENCNKEMNNLEKLSNQSIGVLDNRYHEISAYDVKSITDLIDSKIREDIANMVVTSIWWELKDNLAKLDENHKFFTDTEFFKFIIRYFMDCCEAVAEDFEVQTVKIDIKFVEDNFDPEFARNHSISVRQVAITPKNMQMNAVQQNILSLTQPLRFVCGYCSEAFECSAEHIGKTTGTMMDSACTLYCQREQLSAYRSHIADCKQRSGISVVTTSANIPQFLTCNHSGKSYAVNKCPLHFEQSLPCIKAFSQLATDVPIVVNSETCYIDAICLHGMLVRMAKKHNLGDCNNEYTAKQQEMIRNGVSKKATIHSQKYLGYYFNLKDLSDIERSRFMVVLDDISVSVPSFEDMKSHNDGDLSSLITSLVQDAVAKELKAHSDSNTYVKICEMIKSENTELRDCIKSILEKTKIDQANFEKRVTALEKNMQVAKEKVQDLSSQENDAAAEASDNGVDELANQVDISSLPNKVPMTPFLFNKTWKPMPRYKGPKVPEVANLIKPMLKIDETDYGPIPYLNKEDFVKLYSEASEEIQRRMMVGLTMNDRNVKDFL